MKKNKLILITLSAGLLIGASWAVMAHKPAKHGAKTRPAATVSVTSIQRMPKKQVFPVVGTIQTEKSINLAAQINGLIESLHFKSGQTVARGQLLIVLKHNEQQAALEKARADYDKINDQYLKEKKLINLKFVTPPALRSFQYQLASAKASLDQAKAAYEQCFIHAPFAGQLGIRQVSPGEYLKAGQAIVSLQSTPARYIDFSVPETINQLLTQDTLLYVSSKQSGKTHIKAKIIAKGSQINLSTRTIKIRALLAPSKIHFKPGTYVEVQLVITSKQPVLVVPNIAIDYEPYGASVYVVQNHHAKLRYIHIGATQGKNTVVTSGLKVGDQVVVAGQNKLTDGAPVTIIAPQKKEVAP